MSRGAESAGWDVQLKEVSQELEDVAHVHKAGKEQRGSPGGEGHRKGRGRRLSLFQTPTLKHHDDTL